MEKYSILQQIYVAAVHFAAVGTALYTLKRLFNNSFVTVLGVIAYALIPYRFYTIYVSRDYMEMAAWAVMPAAGYLVYVLFERCRGIFGKIFLGLCSFIVITGIVNCTWYIQNIRKLSLGQTITTDDFSLQAHGVYLIHYLMFFFTDGSSEEFMENGMMNSASMGIGALILIGVGIYIWLLITGKLGEKHDVYNYMLVLGCIAAYLSSNSCQWDNLRFNSTCYKIAYLLIKAPSRLMIIAALFFWVVSCKAYMVLYGIIKQTGSPKSED